MNVRGHFRVSGRVQGVCYRMTAVETARRLGLRGWVRNLRDGSVEVVAEGAEQTVRDFEAWCRRGPELAQVRELRAEYGPASGEFSAFETRG